MRKGRVGSSVAVASGLHLEVHPPRNFHGQFKPYVEQHRNLYHSDNPRILKRTNALDQLLCHFLPHQEIIAC